MGSHHHSKARGITIALGIIAFEIFSNLKTLISPSNHQNFNMINMYLVHDSSFDLIDYEFWCYYIAKWHVKLHSPVFHVLGKDNLQYFSITSNQFANQSRDRIWINSFSFWFGDFKLLGFCWSPDSSFSFIFGFETFWDTKPYVWHFGILFIVALIYESYKIWPKDESFPFNGFKIQK